MYYHKPIMKKVNLYLAHRQIDSLRLISEKLGLPVAEIVRRAVDDFVVQWELWEEKKNRTADEKAYQDNPTL